MQGRIHLTGRAKIVTVIEPATRDRIDLGTQGMFTAVHTASIADAMEAVRDRAVRALLVSPRAADEYPRPAISRLLLRSAGVPTVAVVSERSASTANQLLALGECGVRHVCDLSTKEGWDHLRTIAAQVGGEASPLILEALERILPDACDGAKYFFQLAVRLAPTIHTVRAFAREVGSHPSTLASGFFRIGLPGPKVYLVAMRLIHASYYLDNPEMSFAGVSRILDWSSPQSFYRQIYRELGMTPGEMRRRFTFARMMDHMFERTVTPYRKIFGEFTPLRPRRSNGSS